MPVQKLELHRNSLVGPHIIVVGTITPIVAIATIEQTAEILRSQEFTIR